jgi:phosphohistidine phosphatase SixA
MQPLLRLPLLCTFSLLILVPAQDSGSGPRGPDPALPLEAVTVIALRHAEKDLQDPRDPELTAEGRARARDLTRLLRSAGVTHLFSTDWRRTRQTLAPLAAELDLAIEVYSARSLDAFAKHLAGLGPGSVAVVSGHSNTTPGLVLALGGRVQDSVSLRGTPALADFEYDRLFVTVLPAPGAEHPPAVKTLELRYGRASASK